MGRKKNNNARPAIGSSARPTQPARDLSTESTAENLRDLNRHLITEMVELRKEIQQLRAMLASVDSGRHAMEGIERSEVALSTSLPSTAAVCAVDVQLWEAHLAAEQEAAPVTTVSAEMVKLLDSISAGHCIVEDDKGVVLSSCLLEADLVAATPASSMAEEWECTKLEDDKMVLQEKRLEVMKESAPASAKKRSRVPRWMYLAGIISVIALAILFV